MHENSQSFDNAQGKKIRPPVVVIMGHVDHGKTTLLDYIRKTNVAAKEAGGITQSIGAYEIEHKGKKITFIDTPGHEAFSKMRARGANIADLAVLIVAADDSVQPQTKESIDILNKTNTPFVVAINKIDKPNADVEKTKNDLMQDNVFLEGYGGNVSWQKIAAKAGTGVNELLDLILLAAEVENFTCDPDAKAEGFILEAKMDSRRGITATGIVKNGILKSGDEIATATVKGKVKFLENFLGERKDELGPSAPVLILGFASLPQVGEKFIAGRLNESDFERLKPEKEEKGTKKELAISDNRPSLNLILKADVSGSLEALSGIIRALKQDTVRINILDESVGEIIDGDVKSAQSNNAIIAGFNVKPSKSAENLARIHEIKMLSGKIIYELIQQIEKEMKDIETPPPLGELEVLALFSQKGKKQLIGGKVLHGLMKNNIQIKILRGDEKIGAGRIISLQIKKQEMTQVSAPNECGIIIESSTAIEVGDRLVYLR